METRRVVTCVRTEGRVHSLRLVDEVLPNTDPREVLVHVACAVVDLEPIRAGRTSDIPTGAFLGRVRDRGASADLKPGDLVIGAAPIADHVSVARDRLVPLNAAAQDPHEGLAMLPLVGTLLDALESVGLTLGDRVCVSGRGLAARLVTQLAELSTGSTPSAPSYDGRLDGTHHASAPSDTAGVDLLIDTTADSAWWVRAFPLVRARGRILLLLPAGPQVHPFDFYPMVHRRSLSLLVRRVPEIAGRRLATPDGVQVLQRLFDRGLLAADGLLANARGSAVDLDAHGSANGLVWWFEGQ